MFLDAVLMAIFSVALAWLYLTVVRLENRFEDLERKLDAAARVLKERE